ncbi:hypothetical protein HanIR_Chr09g0434781 [Helianthus annuus]|nr:hypothetical protein HanIR_Chr09g0434781 [Helianthus annuus]
MKVKPNFSLKYIFNQTIIHYMFDTISYKPNQFVNCKKKIILPCSTCYEQTFPFKPVYMNTNC